MEHLDAAYWQNRYEQQTTGWDLGEISPPLKIFMDGLQDRSLRILVPGAGNGHEVAYLHQEGYSEVTLLDIAAAPLARFHHLHPDFPQDHLLHRDFFLHEGQYDLIVEQTFFCAIHPSLRKAYVEKMHELIKPGGKLMGLLFGVDMSAEGPPFGGSQAEYEALFAPYFNIQKLEPCYNSIAPRSGRELFFVVERKV
jgi:methyl halide transferase